MHSTARFLLLAMLLPAFEPLALAGAAQPEAMHCMRKPLQPAANQPTMHCHHAMAQAPTPETPEKSFRALDGCCQNNHDCCRGLKTSEWARPASNLPVYVSLLIEQARVAQFPAHNSTAPAGQDSTRAPPCG